MLKRKQMRQEESVKRLQNSKVEAANYAALVHKRLSEQKEARRSEISKRRSSRKASKKE